MAKEKRLALHSNDVFKVGSTMRLQGHIWRVVSLTEHPDETEKYEYLLERWHA